MTSPPGRPLPDLEALRLLVAVAQGGSIGAGARSVGVTQQSASERLRALEKNEDTAWRVTPEDWRAHRNYDRLNATAERILHETHRSGARWARIDASDPRARNLAIGQLLVARFEEHRRLLEFRTPGPCRPRRSTG